MKDHAQKMLRLELTLCRWLMSVHQLDVEVGIQRSEECPNLPGESQNYKQTADLRNLRSHSDGCLATSMEQTNCSFESENSNSVKEVKAQRLRRKTLSQFKEKLRVGTCAGICTSSFWEKVDVWWDIHEASFSSPHSCPGSSNPPGNWDLTVCAFPLPQSLLNRMCLDLPDSHSVVTSF